jgi:hypothetical protein
MTERHAGDRCGACGTELVEITQKTLKASQSMIHPVIRSIPSEILKSKRERYPICPRSDAYALGVEMDKPFPFLCSDGVTRTFEDLPRLWD